MEKKVRKVNTVTDNRKARHDFFIEDKFEAGLVLLGWEVKSARAGTVNLQDSFVYFEKQNGTTSAVLKNAHFSPFQFGIVATQETKRDRKLLLNASEIHKLEIAVKAKGYTCVPTKIYINRQGRVKLEIALAKGKHTFDKKAAIRERDIARETSKNLL